MSTNLSPNITPTPNQERLTTPVTPGDMHVLADKLAKDLGFDLHENADDSFDLLRWIGPNASPLALALFEGIALEAAITILNSAEPDAWEHLDKLMSQLGPLDPWACEPAEPTESDKAGSAATQKLRADYFTAVKRQAEFKPDKPLKELTLEEQATFKAHGDAVRAAERALHRQHDIEHNLVITDLFLTLSYDEELEKETYAASQEAHESEIIELAIADFNSRFTVPQAPVASESHIEEEEICLHYDSHRWSIGNYELHVNTTDFPGRVELTFIEPD
jgi:hypothetical protein